MSLLPNVFYAQKVITVETINKQLELAGQFVYTSNPEKALPLLEKIEKESKSIGYKSGISKVGYTLAIIYFNSSDYNKVINLSDEFLKIGEENKDYENVSHIYRLKACAYTELGLLSKGSNEYEQALQYAKKMSPGNNKQYALSIIYSNLAIHLMKSGDPQESILANVRKCITEAEKISETDPTYTSKKNSLIAYSYIIIANEYEKAGKLDLAETYYLKSLEIHQNKSVPLVEKVVLLNQLGYFYYTKKEYSKSVQYSEQGIALEKKAKIPQLRRDLFENLSKSYMELNQTDSSKKYFSLFTKLNDSLTHNNVKTLDAVLNNNISSQKELKKKNDNNQKIIYALSGLVLLAFAISFFLYHKRKRQLQKVEKILDQYNAKQSIPEIAVKTPQKSDKTDDKEEEKNILMPPEAEEKLLEKLHNFEEKQLYLERKVSLPYVAAEITTNTKYLTYIIKKYKEKDFSEYINDLRIDYIVQKITNDPVYRQYKISTLAEEAGFSSHSKFATVFKAKIGVSPSEFIKYFQKKGI